MKNTYLAVDIGASSGRHIIGSVENNKIQLQETYRFTNGVHEVHGHLCWDMDHLKDSVIRGIKASVDAGFSPKTMGIDTWAVDYVLLDADDHRIGDTVGYRDSRTQGVRDLLEKHLLVSEYSGRIDEMQLSQSEANKELSTLRQRLNVMKDKEVRILSNGKLLYESIKNGGNTIHWSSMDFLDFLEYFKLIDMDYINRLDSLYSNLSPKQHLFLIARHLGKNEDEVGAILGIGASSVRSLKSRIKSKRIKG